MKNLITMDGNEAAAYISYAFTEIAAIYPITPSSPMAEHVDAWSANQKKNLFGQTVQLVEMQSEHGAAGAMHGALEAGALATSYTASQGLLLMLPAMYRMSGQLHPGVLHVSARSVGTHAFSIFGDHSDVMACRQTGFAMLASSSVQQVMDLAGVAHLAAIKGRVPFLHFFDGFRTSHEIQKIEEMPYEELEKLLDYDALKKFRKNALNPEYPVQRSTVQNPDVYFQNREAANPYFDELPQIVAEYMQEISRITGREYKLFNYYGDENASDIIISMGSSCEVIKETIDFLNRNGRKTGLVEVHLYRPFSVEHLLKEIPETVKRITVLDRTKEPGSAGEPLYKDVCTALYSDKRDIQVFAGRYGLASKDVTPAQMMAVYNNMTAQTPKTRFTVGIEDDLTGLSLAVENNINTEDESTISCKFWGLASDGTVGANKNSIKIIGDNTDMYAQAYFEYDTKKSGGVTKSHLRFGPKEIRSSYLVNQADFVACHAQSYIDKYDMVKELKPDGKFLLNTNMDAAQLAEKLPQQVKKELAEKNIRFFIIDATKIAQEIGLGNRTNTILQAAFFKLSEIIDIEHANALMKTAIEKTYSSRGENIVKMNYTAVDRGIAEVKELAVPAEWKSAEHQQKEQKQEPFYIQQVMREVNALNGDNLPVSIFKDMADGTVPLGTSKYEKRAIATRVPQWIAENCIQCNRCSFVCPHATIRPFLLTEKEKEDMPENYTTIQATGAGFENYQYRIQISPEDCQGCGSCVAICPEKNKALEMMPVETQSEQSDFWNSSLELSEKKNPVDKFSVKGSQLEPPLLEFSGACAGCGETPYMKLMTQLFGDRMYLANATGCTQAWGASTPCVPYTTNSRGFGPAFSNSLFENNAEFSLGMCLAVKQQRNLLASKVEKILQTDLPDKLKKAMEGWLESYQSDIVDRESADNLIAEIKASSCEEECSYILENQEHLVKKSMWMYGGDGWAYDIGFGGLDHVVATGEDVNILIVDTEVYSNTGGQSSKSTPLGAVASFAISGKKTKKKDLGLMLMSYKNIYVAQVSMGANPNQLLKTLKEAEAYPGPSVIIAYAPCITHGIVKGMAYAQQESKLAVQSGYWHLYRYNPQLLAENKNPFMLDSSAPSLPLREFLLGETRYASLMRTFPETAEDLFDKAEIEAEEKYKQYLDLASK